MSYATGSIVKSGSAYFLKIRRNQWRRILPSGLLQGNYLEGEIPGEIVGVVEGDGDTEDVRAIYEQLIGAAAVPAYRPIGFSWQRDFLPSGEPHTLTIRGYWTPQGVSIHPTEPLNYAVLDNKRQLSTRQEFLDIISANDLEREYKRDLERLPARIEAHKEQKRIDDAAAEKQGAMDKKSKRLRKSLDVYLSQFMPMQRANVEKALIDTVPESTALFRRFAAVNVRPAETVNEWGIPEKWEMIEAAIRQGGIIGEQTTRVKKKAKDRWEEFMPRHEEKKEKTLVVAYEVFTEKDLTKTAIDYAEWLRSR